MDSLEISSSLSPKSIQDVLKQQHESGSSECVTDKGMAHLHALLTKDPSKLLERAEAHALKQKRYYHRANMIRTEASSDEEVEVFPFFALPTELRLDVYFELLVTNDPLMVTWRGPRKPKKQQKRMYTAILRANKQCRDEGLTVLYGENVFDMEEIGTRPLSVAKPFVSRISPKNASLIRIVIGEYSAAAEEVHQLHQLPLHSLKPPDPVANPSPTHPHLTVSFLTTFLSAFDINIAHLRVMAISIVPYGFDHATQDLMRKQAPLVVNNTKARVKWLDEKNRAERLETLVDGICEREEGLVKADYWVDVDAWVGFRWSTSFVGRAWMVYRR